MPLSETSPPSDGAADEDDFYGDQDDARSFIEPVISPIATRLTSPNTPAAEKAAAIVGLPGGGLSGALNLKDDTVPEPPPTAPSPRKLSKPRDRGSDRGSPPGQLAPQQPRNAGLPAPWDAGPKEMVVETKEAGRPALSGVFGQSRHQRSASVGENALKRLSKALPSLTMPTNFFPNLPTPSFFSTISQHRDGSLDPPQKPATSNTSSPELVAPEASCESEDSLAEQKDPPQTAHIRIGDTHRPPSVSSRRSSVLRKSASHDSLLYHSLSQVSSYGDDERFANIREQVNSRLKAIKDSWDGPSFKMPQFSSMWKPSYMMPQPILKPNKLDILPAPLKKGPLAWGESLNPEESVRSLPQHGLNQPVRDGASTLDSVLESLTGDIVILGGYRGSVLRSAQPPYRQLWVPVKVGLNMRKVNLEVGLDEEDEENMEKQIFASGMLQNIGPVDISKRLFKKIRECENARLGKLRVHDYGYDWRLSPHMLSRRLVEFLEKLPSNKPGTPSEQRGALVIAHSLGGLMTRHAVNQRPELFSGVVYAGTPQRCVNILGPIRNGDAVLLNEKVLTAQVHFSLRTTFLFLPDDGFCFIDKHTKEEYPVDFYDVHDWIKYRWSPCIGPPMPPFNSRSSGLGSLLNLSSRLSSLPLRARSGSEPKRPVPWPRAEIAKDRTLAPQMDSPSAQQQASTTHQSDHPIQPAKDPQIARNIAYLTRTLAATKAFRAELAHQPVLQAANAYPPLAAIYGRDIPTVYGARVAAREAIACADAYDDLIFRGGDGVVLAREAMPPAGYEIVRGGRVCSDRGHVTLLGDLAAVGRALEAVVRGRRKGIGLGNIRSGGG